MPTLLNPSGMSLLEALKNKGKHVETQCKQGYCGACRVDIVAGEVSYDIEPIAFLKPGQALACCAKARTAVAVAI